MENEKVIDASLKASLILGTKALALARAQRTGCDIEQVSAAARDMAWAVVRVTLCQRRLAQCGTSAASSRALFVSNVAIRLANEVARKAPPPLDDGPLAA